MQLACEVRRGWIKDPKQVKLEDFRLKFANKPRTATPVERHLATQFAKARWGMLMGKPRHSTPPTVTAANPDDETSS
jgi:hypothetical protein